MDPGRVGAHLSLDSTGDGHLVALEIDEQAFFRETRGAQDPVGARHHRRPHDWQVGAAYRQIAG
jgi:hypothetical protein